VNHLRLQVLLVLLHLRDLVLLVLQFLLRVVQLLLLIVQAVDLRLKLIRLLLLYHLDVALSDFFHLGQARVGEAVARNADLRESSVFVESL
jgi:hypothetical protein